MSAEPPAGTGIAPYAAYLRVYEPADALRGPAAQSWKSWADRPEADPAVGAAAERARALAGLLATPPVAVPPRDGDEVFVLDDGGATYVCPLQTRLRCWVALEELRDSVPGPVLDAFLPRVVVDTAEADFARWRADNPGASPHILTSTWQVPLRWFVAFSPTERTVEFEGGPVVGDPGEPAEGVPTEPVSGAVPRRLYYRTSMADARRRVARSLLVLRRTFDTGPLTEGVADLGRWLEDFHPHSRVELDYGGLVSLLATADLLADRSAADVHKALAALAAGDGEAAAASYRRLVDRWRSVGEFGHAS